MQGTPGSWPPVSPARPPDVGAIAMQTGAELGELANIAAVQLIGGLSGLMVSEGLSRVVREILGVGPGAAGAAPARPDAAGADEPGAPGSAGAAGAPTPGEGEALAGLSARALKEMVAQGVVGRVLALNTLNTYLSLAAAEQLRQLGVQLVGAGTAGPSEGTTLSPAGAAAQPYMSGLAAAVGAAQPFWSSPSLAGGAAAFPQAMPGGAPGFIPPPYQPLPAQRALVGRPLAPWPGGRPYR